MMKRSFVDKARSVLDLRARVVRPRPISSIRAYALHSLSTKPSEAFLELPPSLTLQFSFRSSFLGLVGLED